MRSLLIGEAASQVEVAAIRAALADAPTVRRLIHLRTCTLVLTSCWSTQDQGRPCGRQHPGQGGRRCSTTGWMRVVTRVSQ